MDDRRKLTRKNLMAYSAVFDNKIGEQLGLLCDLTRYGLMIICKKGIDVGQDYELRIDLPEEPKFPKNMLRLQAKSVWSRPDIDPKLVNIGFQFLDVNPEDEAIIEQMIDAYSFRRENGSAAPSIYELKS